MQAMAGEEGPDLSRLYWRSLWDIQWLDPEQLPSGAGGGVTKGGKDASSDALSAGHQVALSRKEPLPQPALAVSSLSLNQPQVA